MAAPRVFISSTYYDLRHVREDIGNFIKSMGYEPVMHDKGGVTYAQSETLEASISLQLYRKNGQCCTFPSGSSAAKHIEKSI